VGLLGRIFGSDETKVEPAGLSGQATIVSLGEGGPYVNQRPTITMELDVTVDEPATLGQPDAPTP
jgi:hypothetical protein